jgi:hypothetical protein
VPSPSAFPFATFSSEMAVLEASERSVFCVFAHDSRMVSGGAGTAPAEKYRQIIGAASEESSIDADSATMKVDGDEKAEICCHSPDRYVPP